MPEVEALDDASHQSVREPVRALLVEDEDQSVRAGMALCLSGGGYRAMLFHVGAFLRLNEAGLLRSLSRISSVAGGSLAAGVLAMNWRSLMPVNATVFTNLDAQLVKPIRALASRTIDQWAIIGGAILPGSTIHDQVVASLRKHVYGNATLADLPRDEEGPRFVINATNVQSASLWRFSRPYMGDYRVGLIRNPNILLAKAVAASAAFPPVLSPALLEVKPSDFDPATTGPLFKPPYNDEVYLSDGGVYDNLGLETAYKACRTILVSDGGQKIDDDPHPKGDWAQHGLRVSSIIDNQVRSLRKRQLIDSFTRGDRDGAYWGIRTQITDYALPDALPCPDAAVAELAGIKTRLKAIDDVQQERLINWGYAVCDAALRRHVDAAIVKPTGFPYPRGVA